MPEKEGAPDKENQPHEAKVAYERIKKNVGRLKEGHFNFDVFYQDSLFLMKLGFLEIPSFKENYQILGLKKPIWLGMSKKLEALDFPQNGSKEATLSYHDRCLLMKQALKLAKALGMDQAPESKEQIQEMIAEYEQKEIDNYSVIIEIANAMKRCSMELNSSTQASRLIALEIDPKQFAKIFEEVKLEDDTELTETTISHSEKDKSIAFYVHGNIASPVIFGKKPAYFGYEFGPNDGVSDDEVTARFPDSDTGVWPEIVRQAYKQIWLLTGLDKKRFTWNLIYDKNNDRLLVMLEKKVTEDETEQEIEEIAKYLVHAGVECLRDKEHRDQFAINLTPEKYAKSLSEITLDEGVSVDLTEVVREDKHLVEMRETVSSDVGAECKEAFMLYGTLKTIDKVDKIRIPFYYAQSVLYCGGVETEIDHDVLAPTYQKDPKNFTYLNKIWKEHGRVLSDKLRLVSPHLGLYFEYFEGDIIYHVYYKTPTDESNLTPDESPYLKVITEISERLSQDPDHPQEEDIKTLEQLRDQYPGDIGIQELIRKAHKPAILQEVQELLEAEEASNSSASGQKEASLNAVNYLNELERVLVEDPNNSEKFAELILYINNNPQDRKAHHLLGDVYMKLDKIIEALEEYDIALSIKE